MALVKAKSVADDRPLNWDDSIAAKIQQRRYQILVHSLLYYELDMSIVSDDQWAQWAKELVQLQNAHPSISSRVIFADAFRQFDASTGFNLPFRDEQIVNIVSRQLKSLDTQESEDALYKLNHQVKSTPAEYEKYKKRSHTVKTQPKEVKTVEQKPRKGLFSVPRA